MELKIQSNTDVEFRVTKCCRRCTSWIPSSKLSDKVEKKGTCVKEQNSRKDGNSTIRQIRHQDSICGYFESILKLLKFE